MIESVDTVAQMMNIEGFNPFIPSVYANSVDSDQTPQNAASDLDLHCLH